MCGKTWTECCTDSLSEEEKDLIKYLNNENIMEFGGGRNINSMQKVIIQGY